MPRRRRDGAGPLEDHDGDASVVGLLKLHGRGPVWGVASEDLNATLLLWPAGHAVAVHTNHDRNVLLVVLEGSATATVGERDHALHAGDAILVPKRRPRR